MGCASSSATPAEKYAAPASSSGTPKTPTAEGPKVSPKASPKAAASGRVVEELEVGSPPKSVARVMPEGLLKDADGDEAHEFFVEDPKTGEMQRVVTKDLNKLS